MVVHGHLKVFLPRPVATGLLDGCGSRRRGARAALRHAGGAHRWN